MAAVAEAEVNGSEQAAAVTGIPRSTIRYWLDDPEFADLRMKTREELSDGFKALAHLALTRLMQAIRSGTVEPRDLSVALGIATDKHLLMSGDATTRTETRSLASGLDDHERVALKRVLVDELARRQDRSGDSGARVDAAPAPDSAD